MSEVAEEGRRPEKTILLEEGPSFVSKLQSRSASLSHG